jgi:hypothetical protein
VGAILTKGRAFALGPAKVRKERLAAMFCEGIQADARVSAIFVKGKD